MNNRVYLILVLVLSCALLAVGAGVIGVVYYMQQQALPVAGFSTPPPANTLITPQAANGIQTGAPAPDFAVTLMDGTRAKLSDFHGKPVMLNFWASWCGPCTAEMKNIESVYQKHLNDDFIILAVNQGEGETTVKGYGDLWKLHFRLVRDDVDNASRLYRVQALPTTVFVDKDGKIFHVEIGGPMSVEFIQTQVDKMLGVAK